MLGKRVLWSISLLIILLSSFIISNLDTPQIKENQISQNTMANKLSFSYNGRFFINSTSNSRFITDIYNEGQAIGATYIMYLIIDGNSTSILNISLVDSHNVWEWEGSHNFLMYPGQIKNFTFIAHYCADYNQESLDLYATLINTTAQASGVFNVLIDREAKTYYPKECGTGHLIVSNITELAISLSLASKTTTTTETSISTISTSTYGMSPISVVTLPLIIYIISGIFALSSSIEIISYSDFYNNKNTGIPEI